MLALFLGHVALFSAFPLYFSMLEPLTRRLHFYLYLALILLIGGFLGNAYSLHLAEGLSVSGGNLCYGAFMMTSVLFVLIERDIFILRRVVRLVVVVDLFNIAFSLLASTSLSHVGISNPHGTPAALFQQSVPLILLGGTLIIIELFALFFWFEQVKRWRMRAPFVPIAYLAGFIVALCIDGIVFPLIAFGVSPEIVAIVVNGFAGKVLTALAFSAPLLFFMTFWRYRFATYLKTDVFTWRLFFTTSSDLIRELTANERALRQAETVFQGSEDGLAILHANGTLARANDAFKRFTGAPQATPETWFEHHGKALQLPPHSKDAWRGEVSFGPERKAQGILSITPVPADGFEETTFICSLADITEQKRAQAELDHMAMHDPLTGLPNRRALDAALKERPRPATLAILDLDRFKDVNDSFGHLAGDELLRRVSATLREALRPKDHDHLYRVGGNEFALLLEDTTTAELHDTVFRLNRVLASPFTLDNGATMALTATWGACLSSEATDCDLFAKADAALHDVKQSAQGKLGIYQERLTAEAQRRLTLSLRLRKTLEEQMADDGAPHDGAIFVAYQAQIGRNGELFGFEALARWNDPELGPISPAEFIPLAEDHGMIGLLGTFMLRRACRDSAQWLASGMEFGKIAVNVSGLQMRTPGLVQCVADTLAESGLPPRKLALELTESVFLGRESEVVPIFQNLKALGVQLAIDDFGTGYSSLSLLPMLPWDTLKIDRSFVAPCASDPRRKMLISAIASMAIGLNLRVIAEGVETPEQHRILMDIGCNAFQGFLFAKPVPASEIASSYKEFRGIASTQPSHAR